MNLRVAMARAIELVPRWPTDEPIPTLDSVRIFVIPSIFEHIWEPAFRHFSILQKRSFSGPVAGHQKVIIFLFLF